MAVPTPSRILLLAGVLIAVTTGTVGCVPKDDGPTPTRTDSKSFALPGGVLHIKASETGLRLTEGSGDKLKVTRTSKGAAIDAGNSVLTMKGDTLTVSVECSGLVRSCESTSSVAIPRGTAVVLDGSGATVMADGLSGRLELRVRNDGTLTVRRSSGTLRLTSGGGAITVTESRSGDVEARATADANIRLDFREPPRRVDARASGSVRVTVPSGPATYRILSSGVRGTLKSDPASSRSLRLEAADGVARADRAG